MASPAIRSATARRTGCPGLGDTRRRGSRVGAHVGQAFRPACARPNCRALALPHMSNAVTAPSEHWGLYLGTRGTRRKRLGFRFVMGDRRRFPPPASGPAPGRRSCRRRCRTGGRPATVPIGFADLALHACGGVDDVAEDRENACIRALMSPTSATPELTASSRIRSGCGCDSFRRVSAARMALAACTAARVA